MNVLIGILRIQTKKLRLKIQLLGIFFVVFQFSNIFIFFREFQLITSAHDNSSLLSD